MGWNGCFTRENSTKDRSQAGKGWRALSLSPREDLSRWRRSGSYPLSSLVASLIGLEMADMYTSIDFKESFLLWKRKSRKSAFWGMVALKRSNFLERHQFSKKFHLLAYTLSVEEACGAMILCDASVEKSLSYRGDWTISMHAGLKCEDCGGMHQTWVVSTFFPRGSGIGLSWVDFWRFVNHVCFGLKGATGWNALSGCAFGGLEEGYDGDLVLETRRLDTWCWISWQKVLGCDDIIEVNNVLVKRLSHGENLSIGNHIHPAWDESGTDGNVEVITSGNKDSAS